MSLVFQSGLFGHFIYICASCDIFRKISVLSEIMKVQQSDVYSVDECTVVPLLKDHVNVTQYQLCGSERLYNRHLGKVCQCSR